MKKEAVSTFNEGLNYDLNPITTPNNVLTDCVNGTFLTANGNELALQNDSGNATIKVNFLDAPNYVALRDSSTATDKYIYGDKVSYKTSTGTEYYININNNRIANPLFTNTSKTSMDNWVFMDSAVILSSGTNFNNVNSGIFISVNNISGSLKQTLNLEVEKLYDLSFVSYIQSLFSFTVIINYLDKDFKRLRQDTQNRSNPTLLPSYEKRHLVIRPPINTKYTEIIFKAKGNTGNPYSNFFFIGDISLLAKPTNLSNTEVWKNISEVSLSNDFYPLAIKEYGGILYIVSGKKDSTGDQIEFGSYPCPNKETEGVLSSNKPYTYKVDKNKSNLLSSQIINDTKFSAGQYIVFNSTEPNLSNVSYFKYLNNTLIENKLIYKIRLIQQLSNGFIDLTENVWEQYALFRLTHYKEWLNVSGSGWYWFNDPLFKYYCPNNFKGKLALVTEIEPLETFKLIGYNGTWNQDESNYECTFNLKVESNSALTVKEVLITYIINGEEKSQICALDKLNSCKLIIPYIPAKQQLTYKITPKCKYTEYSITDYLDAPDSYLTAHTITGSDVISPKYKNIHFIGEDSVCELNNVGEYSGYSYYTKLRLVNEQGYNIDNSLQLTDKSYRVYLENPPINSDPYFLGTYSIAKDGKTTEQPSWNPELLLTKQSIVEDALINTEARFLSEDCIKPTLVITTSYPLRNELDVITLTQGDTVIAPEYDSQSLTTSVFTFKQVQANQNCLITLERDDLEVSTYKSTYNFLVNNKDLKLVQYLNLALVESIKMNQGLIYIENTQLWSDWTFILNMEYYESGAWNDMTWTYNTSTHRYEFIVPAGKSPEKIRPITTSPWYAPLDKDIEYININSSTKTDYCLGGFDRSLIFRTEYILTQ